MMATSKRVTVQYPRCNRNVTVVQPADSCLDHWCARCQAAFIVWLDAAGNVTKTKEVG
jgi:hypothetical protein